MFTKELLPTNKIKVIQIIQRLYNDTKDTNDTIDTNIPHPKPSMPQVALTPLGLPSLASNHKSTQGSDK